MIGDICTGTRVIVTHLSTSIRFRSVIAQKAPYWLLIHYESQHTLVRAFYGLYVADFGFTLAFVVFKILSSFWQNDSFF